MPIRNNKITKKNMRATTWTAILYPEQLKKHWQRYLTATKYQWFCSPIHDRDVYEDDKEPDENGNGGHKKGDLKKEHFHVGVYFGSGNPKSLKQAIEIISNAVLDGCHILEPQPSRNMKKLVQYFIHKNDKGKFQYSRDDIRAFNNFDVAKFFDENMGPADGAAAIIEYADEHKIYSFASLFRNIKEDMPEAVSAMIKYATAIRYFIESARADGYTQPLRIKAKQKETVSKIGNMIRSIAYKKVEEEKELEEFILNLPENDEIRIEYEREQIEYEKEFAQLLIEDKKNKKATENHKPVLAKDTIFKQKNHYVNSETGEIVDFVKAMTDKNKLKNKPNYIFSKL